MARYYIDYEAGNDGNGGTSPMTPWKRCPGMCGFAATYVHTVGDVFIFKGGVTIPYVGNSSGKMLEILYDGSIATPDVYTSEPTWFTGTEWTEPTFNANNPVEVVSAISATDRSHLVFEKFRFEELGCTAQNQNLAAGTGINVTGSGANITIQDCKFAGNCIDAIHYGTNTGKVFTGLYIYRCDVRRSGRVHLDAQPGELHDIRIIDFTMEGGWDYYPSGGYHTDGIMINGGLLDRPAITGLVIRNAHFWGDWSRGATGQIYLSGVSPLHQGTKDTLICNVTVTPSNITCLAKTPAGLPDNNAYEAIQVKYGHENLRIHNVIADCRALSVRGTHGISCHSGINGVDIRNVILLGYNNGVYLGSSNVSGTRVIDNAIIQTAANNHFIWIDGVVRHDTIAACKAGGWLQTYGSNADPLIVAPVTPADAGQPGYGITNGDYHLREGSPAIGNGANLSSLFTTDLDGVERGATWDIGAYEYVASEPPDPPDPPAAPPANPKRRSYGARVLAAALC